MALIHSPSPNSRSRSKSSSSWQFRTKRGRAVEIIGGEEDQKRRQEIIAKLAQIHAKGGSPRLPDFMMDGRPLTQILSNEANTGPPLRLDEMLTLHEVLTGAEADIATFELPVRYDALTNIGTLRLVCDAGPWEKAGNEALMQECLRATNGNCLLLWNTSYDPPGQHFLQAELILSESDGESREDRQVEQAIPIKGPLFSFVSTNVVQFFPHADSYTDQGAVFRVKLAQAVGSYSLKLTTLSGENIHTITGSTTNGLAEVYWDLLYDGGKRYTNESFNSTWTVTFPGPPKPGSTNLTHATPRR